MTPGKETKAMAPREVREAYRSVSSAAAMAERNKHWFEAAKYWREAKGLANSQADRDHCQRRREFCTNQHERMIQEIRNGLDN